MLNTDHFAQCIRTLEFSLDRLNLSEPESIDYDIFRNATIKGFELSLEMAGKLLRKALKTYTAIPREIDELNYKEVFRFAAKQALLSEETVERWYAYRDNRNNTAHDYGIAFANTTVILLPQFLKDAKALLVILEKKRLI